MPAKDAPNIISQMRWRERLEDLRDFETSDSSVMASPWGYMRVIGVALASAGEADGMPLEAAGVPVGPAPGMEAPPMPAVATVPASRLTSFCAMAMRWAAATDSRNPFTSFTYPASASNTD